MPLSSQGGWAGEKASFNGLRENLPWIISHRSGDEQLESVKWPLSNRGSNCCILMFFCYRSLSQTFCIRDAETDQIMRDDESRVENGEAV